MTNEPVTAPLPLRRGPKAIPQHMRLNQRKFSHEDLVPRQHPREFCFVLLKGCQTRWLDKEAQADEYLKELRTAATPHRAFRYCEIANTYVEWFGVQVPMVVEI